MAVDSPSPADPLLGAGPHGNPDPLGFDEDGSDTELRLSDVSLDVLEDKDDVDPGSFSPPNSFTYEGGGLSLIQLQTGLNRLVVDVWSQLLALSGNEKVKIQIPESMSEDIDSTEEGHSFIDQIKAVGNGRKVEVDPGAPQEFFHKIKPIVEAIAFLTHVTSSELLRPTEVVDDRYRNGSSPRNLLVTGGLVFFLRRNLTPSSSTGYRSSVFHFPPPKVTELIIYYLAVVRPVEIFFARGLGWADQLSAYSEFLHVVQGKKLSSHELSGVIASHTDRYFGCRLSARDLQRVLVNMVDIQPGFLPPIVNQPAEEFHDSQAGPGHSTHVAGRVYGKQTENLPGEQPAGLIPSYTRFQKLHTLLGLGSESPPGPPASFLRPALERTCWKVVGGAPLHPPSVQENADQLRLAMDSALSSVTDELTKGCEQTLSEPVLRTYKTSSVVVAPNPLSASQASPPTPDDLQVLPLVPTTVSFPSRHALQLSYPFILQPDPVLRPKALKSAPSKDLGEEALLHVLSLYTKRPGCTFTSEKQRLLLREVLQPEHDNAIAILPTGSGKSVAIFGPPLIEKSGISVVITPYTALRLQLAEQARSFGIKHLVWSDRNSPGSPNPTSVRLIIMIIDDVFKADARS